VTTTLPEDQRLQQISARAFEHPADRAATAALKSIPMLDVVVRKLIELGYERSYRGELIAGSLRLGEQQLPEAWADHVAAYSRLDLQPVPHLFMAQVPFANAAAVGAGTPLVVVHSRTVELLDRQELRTVLAHEAGHVLAEHVMYRTALLILLQLTGLGRLGLFAGLPLLGVRLALLEWFRAAELSADRAATLVNRDPLITCRTLMVLAGGIPSERLNLDQFIEQGRSYREAEGFDKLSRMRSELGLTHARPVKRVHEIMNWVQSGAYDRIVAGDYVRRGSEAGFREEADAAQEHYAERFRTLFREAGEGVAKVGEQLADASEKASGAASDAADRIADWLRGGRGGSGDGA
jgi:Zn-dependent protease with chaperone function